MGLFGGFKAKFTKDSTAKSASKRSRKDEVVCLGYRVHSEFQDPPSYIQQSRGVSPRKPSAIKTVLPRPDSSKNGTSGVSTSRAVETRIITNPDVTRSSFKQITNTLKPTIVEAASIDDQELTTSRTNYANENLMTIGADNANKTNTVELRHDKANSLGRFAPNPTSSDNHQYVTPSQTAPKSILKSKPLERNEPNNYIAQYSSSSDSENDEYNKLLTVSSINIQNADETETKSVNYLTAARTVSGGHTTQVTTMVQLENTSKLLEASQNKRSIGATSNHAANIFFDGDDEPEVQRPRRLNLQTIQDEDAPRSSAEC